MIKETFSGFNMQKAMEISLGIALLAIVAFIISIVLFSVHSGLNTEMTDYYHAQANLTCELSNQYRQMLILKNPEMTLQLPSELNCTKILEINLS